MSAPADRRRADRELAERVRRACFETAARAAEDAGISGLCADGRLEAALDAVRSMPVEDLLPADSPAAAGPESSGSESPARE